MIRSVQTKSCRMAFFRFGRGKKTFVILPGLSPASILRSAHAIEKKYGIFSEAYTCYLFDRRENPPKDYTIEQLAEDTAQAMIALALSGVHLFGASQGGMAAQLIAIRHPELVSRLALGSTAAYVDAEGYEKIEAWARLAEKKDGEALYDLFCRKIYPPSFYERHKKVLASFGEKLTDEDFERFVILARTMKNLDLRKELRKVSCPTLVLGAKDDAMLGPSAADVIAEGLINCPDVQLHCYDGFGHAVFDMAPDYQERLLRFFEA